MCWRAVEPVVGADSLCLVVIVVEICNCNSNSSFGRKICKIFFFNLLQIVIVLLLNRLFQRPLKILKN